MDSRERKKKKDAAKSVKVELLCREYQQTTAAAENRRFRRVLVAFGKSAEKA